MADAKNSTPQDAPATQSEVEVTIAELKSIVKELRDRLEKLETKELETSMRIENLKVQNDGIEEAINQLLESKNAPTQTETPAPGLKGTVFTIGKKKYKLQYPVFTWNGKQYTEDSLLADKDVQDELVEAGSKLLLPV
jgi:chromosome segregation ATPase